MYVIPPILIVLIALAIFFSPILAVILCALAIMALGAYKFLGPGTADSASAPGPSGAPVTGEGGGQATEGGGESTGQDPSHARGSHGESKETGLWGERWPEQRH